MCLPCELTKAKLLSQNPNNQGEDKNSDQTATHREASAAHTLPYLTLKTTWT